MKKEEEIHKLYLEAQELRKEYHSRMDKIIHDMMDFLKIKDEVKRRVASDWLFDLVYNGEDESSVDYTINRINR